MWQGHTFKTPAMDVQECFLDLPLELMSRIIKSCAEGRCLTDLGSTDSFNSKIAVAFGRIKKKWPLNYKSCHCYSFPTNNWFVRALSSPDQAAVDPKATSGMEWELVAGHSFPSYQNKGFCSECKQQYFHSTFCHHRPPNTLKFYCYCSRRHHK